MLVFVLISVIMLNGLYIFVISYCCRKEKKVGAARCEYVFDVHTSKKASKSLKVVL